MTASLAARRLFLRQAGALSLLGGAAAPWALNLVAAGSAAAQSAADYKALVCVFLYGGNDAFNTVLATDEASWSNYTKLRNQEPDSLALLPPGAPAVQSAAAGSPARLGGVVPITPLNAQGRSFALHPQLEPLRALFDKDKRLAIVANVGPLALPTTKAQYETAGYPRPPKLFSHNDQQSVWQSMGVEGSTRGWGGRMADYVAGMNSRANFTAISTFGNAVWLSGQTVHPYQMGNNGPIRIGTDPNGSLYGSARVGEALRRVAGSSFDGDVLEADYAAVGRRSMEAEAVLSAVLPPQADRRWATPVAKGSYMPLADPMLQYQSPLEASRGVNPLAHQLQAVARMVQAGLSGSSGVKRQVFFVGLSGFDTHTNQNKAHADLMARLAQGLIYFDTVLGTLGARDRVTTFTASDFGRSFTSNGNGTDHGWGGHHMVMGAAVRGGDLYGSFPLLGSKNAGNNRFDSSPNQLVNGVLLPEVSVDQYGATLGRWFGLSATELVEVFPSLAEFDTRDLRFMA